MIESEKIRQKFPNLYSNPVYFDCGKGWFSIIERLSRELEEIIIRLKEETNNEGNYYPQASQVKEKFGTLRFYLTTGTDEMFELIEKAETESSKTCEACGKHGSLRRQTYLVTLCDSCFQG